MKTKKSKKEKTEKVIKKEPSNEQQMPSALVGKAKELKIVERKKKENER